MNLSRISKRRKHLTTKYFFFFFSDSNSKFSEHSKYSEQHSLKFPQSLPKCSRTSKLLPPCRGEIHGRQWGTTPNSPSLVLALIDVLVVQSHIMWRWSTANSHNRTFCFLFSSLFACFTVWPCFSVVYCCTFSFVSGRGVCVCVCFFFFSFLSHIVHCNSAFGPGFGANKIISYHIIPSIWKANLQIIS